MDVLAFGMRIVTGANGTDPVAAVLKLCFDEITYTYEGEVGGKEITTCGPDAYSHLAQRIAADPDRFYLVAHLYDDLSVVSLSTTERTVHLSGYHADMAHFPCLNHTTIPGVQIRKLSETMDPIICLGMCEHPLPSDPMSLYLTPRSGVDIIPIDFDTIRSAHAWAKDLGAQGRLAQRGLFHLICEW